MVRGLHAIPDGPALERARQEGIVVAREHEGFRFEVFADDFHGVPRGVAVAGDNLVPVYPSIARILTLKSGIERNLPGQFYAEEKIDGYNVRIFTAGGRLIPLTRGGYVCPFTADRLPDFGPIDRLLGQHPDLVVCGEVAGKMNPYCLSGVNVPDDVGFFAFDLMRLNSVDFISLPERDAILERFEIPRAPLLGRFHANEIDRLRSLVMELDARGAEGMVLKPLGEGVRIKYVTPQTNVGDITVDAHLLAEIGGPFFLNHLLRLAMGLEELGLRDRIGAIEREIGHAFVSGFLATVDAVKEGGNVAEQITVRLRSPASADRLIDHFNQVSRTIHARELTRRVEDGYTVVTIEKVFLSSSSKIRDLLDGIYVID